MANMDLTGATEYVVVPTNIQKETGIDQQGLVAALQACIRAICAICNNLDEDGGTLGADYDALIGTPMLAVLAKVERPHGTKAA